MRQKQQFGLYGKGGKIYFVINRTREREKTWPIGQERNFSGGRSGGMGKMKEQDSLPLWQEAGVIVNATSLGLKEKKYPYPGRNSPSVWIVDVVYRRGLTPLVREAKREESKALTEKKCCFNREQRAFSFYREKHRLRLWRSSGLKPL